MPLLEKQARTRGRYRSIYTTGLISQPRVGTIFPEIFRVWCVSTCISIRIQQPIVLKQILRAIQTESGRHCIILFKSAVETSADPIMAVNESSESQQEIRRITCEKFSPVFHSGSWDRVDLLTWTNSIAKVSPDRWCNIRRIVLPALSNTKWGTRGHQQAQEP